MLYGNPYTRTLYERTFPEQVTHLLNLKYDIIDLIPVVSDDTMPIDFTQFF